jgi:hypothetical protein
MAHLLQGNQESQRTPAPETDIMTAAFSDSTSIAYRSLEHTESRSFLHAAWT